MAKGIGILLVVFGHAWRGYHGSESDISEPLYSAVDNAIYAFHMPLFFFLSALLFLDVLRKSSLGGGLLKRAERLLWPLCLWTWIFFAVKLLAGEAQNAPVSLSDFPLIPLPPFAHLWFLWALFLIQAAVLLIYAVFLRRRSDRIARLTFATLAVVLTLAMPFIVLPSPYWGAAVAHAPYFLAGIAFSHVARNHPDGSTAILALGVAALLIVMATDGAVAVHSMLIVLLLWAGLTGLYATMDHDNPLNRVLRYLGIASLAIYLSHTIFSAGIREALFAAGIENLAVHLVAAVLVGVIFPILLLELSRRLGLRRLLGF